MASSLRVFGLDADKAGLAADKLLRITNRTALQSNEMTLAIGNIGRGVGLTKQSMDEMLPALGLVRNSGVAASVASSSVSSALIFMAKNAKRFKDVGIEVTDATGKFRPFMDIVLDTEKALGEKFPNAAVRTKKAVEMFGRFGVTAFSAITSQVGKGIRDTEGNLLKGEQAINFLRDAMKNAGGAAGEFKDALLNTFEGQKVLLKGSLETMAVELGKPFATLFKPVVTGVIKFVNMLIGIWVNMPKGVRLAMSAIFLFGMALLFVVGAATALALVIMLLSPFLATMGVVAGYAALAMLALGAVFGAVALAGIGLYYAIKNNLGGMGDFFNELKMKVQLAWTGISMILSGKGLSNRVAIALKAWGVLDFVQTIASIVLQVKAFWGGMVEGFKAGLATLEPAWNALKSAVSEVGSAIGVVSKDMAMSGGGMNSMAGKGRSLGLVLANLVGMLVELVSWALLIGATFIKVGVWIKQSFGTAIAGVVVILMALWSLLKNIVTGLAWVLTLGGAGGTSFTKDWEGITKYVQDRDEAKMKTQREMAHIGMRGGIAAPAQAMPATQYVVGTGAGGIGAVDPKAIEQATYSGVQRGLSSTPVQLKAEMNGRTFMDVLHDVDVNTRNGRGVPQGGPAVPSAIPRGQY
jgi:TP901 family phage tail tape measure protein